MTGLPINITGRVVAGNEGEHGPYSMARLEYALAPNLSVWLVPGVYASRVNGILPDYQFSAVVVVRPSLTGGPLVVEAYVIDVKEDLTGRELEYILIDKISDEIISGDSDQTRHQIEEAIDYTVGFFLSNAPYYG